MVRKTEPPVTDAVILMAGAGSRLGLAGGAFAKPLVQIGDRALICYAFHALQRAGVRNIHAVMGANSERLAREVQALLPAGITFSTIVNPDWEKQNGVSVLCAAGKVQAPFFLVMGDHLYEFAILEALLTRGDRARVNLAIDRKIDSIFDLDDAMKVQTRGAQIVAIAKDLPEYDAIDTGVFLCSEEIFAYLRRAAGERGDCSLSDGIRLLAADGKMRVIDVGNAWWQDVDTPEMLARAEQESGRLLSDGRSGRPQESIPGQR
ncbi:MAG: NTP transferase domain-containing protein [Chthoniobacterales bacterium]|nr:NTP transferase domain-containing protein [Chthoniobacterales bacterium]